MRERDWRWRMGREGDWGFKERERGGKTSGVEGEG